MSSPSLTLIILTYVQSPNYHHIIILLGLRQLMFGSKAISRAAGCHGLPLMKVVLWDDESFEFRSPTVYLCIDKLTFVI
jgi:hypothetical protein